MPTANIFQSEFTGEQMDARFAAVTQLTAALEELTTVVAGKYVKPSGGIPSTDLDADVNAALAKANSAVQSLADYYTKTEVDQLLAAINGMDYVDVSTLPTASASTLGKIYLVGPDGSGYYAYYYTSYNGSAYSWVGPLGTTQISLSNYATKTELGQIPYSIAPLVDSRNSGSLSALLTNESYFTVSDGVFSESSSSSWMSSGYIKVTSRLFRAELYVDSSPKPHVAFFNENKEYIGQNVFNYAQKVTVSFANMTIPSGAAYFRVQSKASNSASYTFTLVRNKDYFYESDYMYDAFNNVALSSICIVPSYLQIVNNVLTESASAAWMSSDYIEIARYLEFGIQLYVDTADKPRVMYFDKDRTYIGRGDNATTGAATFDYSIIETAPANAKYVRFQSRVSYSSNYKYNAVLLKEIENNEYTLDLTNAGVLASGLINKALSLYKHIYIVSKNDVLLNAPILLDSNNSIRTSPYTVFKLVSTTRFMMNKAINGKTVSNLTYDNETNICVDGGIWDADNKVTGLTTGCKGAALFIGVHGLQLKNMTFRKTNSSYFAIQVNTANNMLLSNLRFEETVSSDAIHLGGDISDFTLDGIFGYTGDDFIALNAWDWAKSSPHYGTIQKGAISNVHCSDSWHIIRMLGATDGTSVYTVKDVSIRDVFGNADISVIDAGFQDESPSTGLYSATEMHNICIDNVHARTSDNHDKVNVINVTGDIDNLTIKNCVLSSEDTSLNLLVLTAGSTISKLNLLFNILSGVSNICSASAADNNATINSIGNTFSPSQYVVKNEGTGSISVTSLMDVLASGAKSSGAVVWTDK